MNKRLWVLWNVTHTEHNVWNPDTWVQCYEARGLKISFTQAITWLIVSVCVSLYSSFTLICLCFSRRFPWIRYPTANLESGCHGDSRISAFIRGDNLCFWCTSLLSDFLQLFPLSGFRKQVSIWVSIATPDIMGWVSVIHLVRHGDPNTGALAVDVTRSGPAKPQRHASLASKAHVWNTERQLQYYTIWKHL